MNIDYSRLQQIKPSLPLNSTAYLYYIQYGRKKVIRISEPGPGTQQVPILITVLDYETNMSTADVIIRESKLYYSTEDSVKYSIDESLVSVYNPCSPTLIHSYCDSVMITSKLDKSVTWVYFNDSTKNILSRDLFYPDIQFLPSKIVPNKAGRASRILEKIIVGKNTIDSLLFQFNHMGYKRITTEEMNAFLLENPIESVKALIPEKD